jgi:uncharacterized protein involved in exopolysaccharide biosynthesis
MADFATKAQRTLVDADESDQRLGEAELPDTGDDRGTRRLRLFWDRRRTIALAGILGAVVSSAAAFLIPSRYTSTARLMPPDQSSSSTAMLAALTGGMAGGRGSALGALAGDMLGLKNSGDLFVGVLQSRTVEDNLINKFNLRKEYGDKLIEDARKDLEKKTGISTDRKSGIIVIEVTDYSASKAAAMVQEYIDGLNRVVTKLNTSSASREREFLESRLGQVRNDLESAERNFSTFASKNTAIDIPAQGKALIEAAATLEGQLIATQTELESLRQVYTQNNVRVKATQARIDELRRQLQKLGGSANSEPSNSSDIADQSIPSIRQLPLLGVPYADLYRDTKVQEAIYEALTEEYELAKVQEAKETPSVKILDAADVPQKKSFPPRVMIIILGSLFACCAALAWVSGRAAWDGTDALDPRKLLAVEVSSALRKSFARGRGNYKSSNESSTIWSRLRLRRNRRA